MKQVFRVGGRYVWSCLEVALGVVMVGLGCGKTRT